MSQYIVLRDPPPNRRLYCDGPEERHLTEAAVMIAFAMHLLEKGATALHLHPDGEQGKKYDIRGSLEAHGFRLVGAHGRTTYGGIYQRAHQTVNVTLMPGLGDVVAGDGERRLIAECKGGIVNTRHPGQVQKLRRGLCEALGLLMARRPQGERQVAVVPATAATERIARQMSSRALKAGIEIALVDEAGGVRFIDHPG
jgi:hypothetical protein